MIGRTMALGWMAALMLAGAARAEIVAVPGGELYYETCGAGPRTIVLLHDGVLDSASFDEMWPILCRQFRVVRYDRRGFGRSPGSKTPYSPTEDLGAVMRAADVTHATIVGVSAGGGIATDFALDHPEAVDGLVLSGAAINGFQVSDHFNRRNQRIEQPIFTGGVAAVMQKAAEDPYLLAPGHKAAADRAMAIVMAHPNDLTHDANDPIRPGLSAIPRLPGLKPPVLILVGDHDHPDVQAMAGVVQVLAPHAQRVVMDDAGHLMPLEHPQEMAGLIAGFVNQEP